MKRRTDFVTNSSSSSFIFGAPRGEDWTEKKVLETLQMIAYEIVSVVNYFTNNILTTEENNKFNEISKRYKEHYGKRVNSKNVDDYIAWQSEGNAIFNETNEFLDKYEEKKYCKIMDKYIKENTELSLKWEDIILYLFSSLSKIKQIADYEGDNIKDLGIGVGIIDFRNKVFGDGLDGFDISEILSWYDVDNNCDEDSDIEYMCEIAYNNLGEVALCGECGNLTYLIEAELMHRLEHSCNHMG